MRLFRLMRLRGVFLWDPPTAGEARDLTLAMRRCLGCRDEKHCDELFAKGDTKGHRQFCPNISYIDGLAKRRDG